MAYTLRMARQALLIIAPQGYQDTELSGTRYGLAEAGFDVVLASTEACPCTGKYGGTEEATIALRDVRVDAFDRIGYIGGPGASALADDAEAQRIARDTVTAQKPLGAICIAPTILAKAGVLRGRQATAWNDDGVAEQILTSCGAHYVAEHLVQDGLILTADGPKSAEAFGKAFAALR